MNIRISSLCEQIFSYSVTGFREIHTSMESVPCWYENTSNSDDESEEECCVHGDEDSVENYDDDKLHITQKQADLNYEAAGNEVNEDEDGINVQDYQELIDPEVDMTLNEIVFRINMPYTPADFQRVSINALAKQKNVILISPTGSGKLNVPLLATLVLREQLNNPKGILLLLDLLD